MSSILISSHEDIYAHMDCVDRSVTFADRCASFHAALDLLERDDKHEFSSCLPEHAGFPWEGSEK